MSKGPPNTVLRRRDFLRRSVIVVLVFGVVKGAWRTLRAPDVPAVSRDPQRLVLLTPRTEAIYTAAALAMVGPTALLAYDAGEWDPAADFDALLGRLAPDQASLVSTGLLVLQEWTLGFTGFTELSRDDQIARLEAWRTGSLGLHRSVWGVIHAGACSSFSSRSVGWRVMGYPGPCLATDGPGRPPGQTAPFVWDPEVP